MSAPRLLPDVVYMNGESTVSNGDAALLNLQFVVMTTPVAVHMTTHPLMFLLNLQQSKNNPMGVKALKRKPAKHTLPFLNFAKKISA
ncbi:hypothetical protein QQ045_030855 [Rhodiola kirilowii]